MKKIILLLTLFCMAMGASGQEKFWTGPSVDFSHGRLRISDNKRFLQFEDGTPFFYLGDTGWELFHRLNLEEAEQYLENRRAKGFTVIQAVILAELDGLHTPNAEGNLPLIGDNPLTPNEPYFLMVDKMIRLAGQKGLYMGVLPTWGDKVDKQWGIGPVVFNKHNAFSYGQWIGRRYRDFPNIIWILGGDRDGGNANQEIFEAMAKGIRSEDTCHLMTFHPWGECSSSLWYQNSAWLDFNMMQTGHAQRSYAIYKRLMEKDYALRPVKPTLDGEPRYEDHPVNWKPDLMGWFDDADIRQALYWGLFSGGCGSSYGCHPVWQMKTPSREPIGLVRHNWYESLDLPGASELIFARRLLESRPFFSRIPDPDLLAPAYYPETDFITATRGDGYAFVYFPTGSTATVLPQKLGAREIMAWWFNPRNGEVTSIGKLDGNKPLTITPPSAGRGNDWILVLDDASRKFKTPGE